MRTKVALCEVFSHQLITIIISLARFLVYTVTDYSLDDASGNLWCIAESCIATIIVSLPTLKVLVLRSAFTSTSTRSDNGNRNSGSKKHIETIGSRSRKQSLNHLDTYQSHVEAGPSDDKIELFVQKLRKSSTSLSHTVGTSHVYDEKEGVRVTTNVTIVRDVL
ncbi:hypothetical protein DE146DRAFT_718391 [Phaeosphaeria sp. MPI-PUGE-AT-0046c]|nr:hypothetical protein DE146DRAFT_718391 [Phaeosphaeria sp. MPI-PUGE-AT-0046c]